MPGRPVQGSGSRGGGYRRGDGGAGFRSHRLALGPAARGLECDGGILSFYFKPCFYIAKGTPQYNDVGTTSESVADTTTVPEPDAGAAATSSLSVVESTSSDDAMDGEAESQNPSGEKAEEPAVSE